MKMSVECCLNRKERGGFGECKKAFVLYWYCKVKTMFSVQIYVTAEVSVMFLR